MSAAPLLMNILGAFAQRGPERNTDYDNAIYDDITGAFTDANGNPIDNRYKKASLYTKMFNPEAATAINNAETNFQMASPLAKQQNAIVQGIGASNIEKYRPYVGKSFNDTPSDAISAMTNGDARIQAVDPAIGSSDSLNRGLPITENTAREVSLGNDITKGRRRALIGAPGAEADSDLFGAWANQMSNRALLEYQTPYYDANARQAIAVNEALRADAGRTNIEPEAKRQIAETQVGMNEAQRQIAAKEQYDAINRDKADAMVTHMRQAALDSSLNAQTAHVRSLADRFNANFIPSPENPTATIINDDDSFTVGGQQIGYVSPQERMKYMMGGAPLADSIARAPGGASLPMRNTYSSTGLPVGRTPAQMQEDAIRESTKGTPEYNRVFTGQGTDFNDILNSEYPNKSDRAAKKHEATKEIAKAIANYYDKNTTAFGSHYSLYTMMPAHHIYEALTNDEGRSGDYTKQQVIEMFNSIPHDERQDIYKKALIKVGAIRKDGKVKSLIRNIATPWEQ